MNTLPPVHPGEVLLEDFMKPVGLSQYRLAKDIGVPALRISQIVRGQRAITADTALRLACYFDTSPDVWRLMILKWRSAKSASGSRVRCGPCIRLRPDVGDV